LTTAYQHCDYWYDQVVAPRVREVLQNPDAHPRSLEALKRDALPLVSVIMATGDRPGLLSIALECYRRQTYRRRELIVVDDGVTFPVDEEAIAALGGRLIRVPEDTPLGVKLNQGIQSARGRLCQKWDDDDWYAPHCLEALVSTYLGHNATVCRPTIAFHVRRLWFDLARWRILAWPNDGVSGGTLIFAREDWEEHPFREIRTCLDLWFVVDQVRAGASPVPIDAAELYIYVRHDATGAERSHLWERWLNGQKMEKYLRRLPSEGTDPAEMFPDWALSTYAGLSGSRHGSDIS
jgi:glycosyltransferase involved in cell wall biosynthesis